MGLIIMLITILQIIILIFSVILHEVSHGYMAERLGDPTARMQGRLTLNPLRHIDPLGSIIVPIITSFLGFTFGWAKPVVYNPYNLKNRRRDEVLIAMAGPASNLIIAIIFGLVIRFSLGSLGAAAIPFVLICTYIVVINIALAVFNLIPLPPLDGSKLFFALFPRQYGRTRVLLELYAPFFVLIVILFLWQFVTPVIPALFRLITGAAL